MTGIPGMAGKGEDARSLRERRSKIEVILRLSRSAAAPSGSKTSKVPVR